MVSLEVPLLSLSLSHYNLGPWLSTNFTVKAQHTNKSVEPVEDELVIVETRHLYTGLYTDSSLCLVVSRFLDRCL